MKTTVNKQIINPDFLFWNTLLSICITGAAISVLTSIVFIAIGNMYHPFVSNSLYNKRLEQSPNNCSAKWMQSPSPLTNFGTAIAQIGFMLMVTFIIIRSVVRKTIPNLIMINNN